MKRAIAGECVAVRLAERPSCIPKGRPRGLKAAGCRYERAFGEAAAQRACAVGPWFQFADINGRGFCQPDVLFRAASGEYVVAECKMTDFAAAERELEQLYIPVVRAALAKPTVGLIVLRHLNPIIVSEHAERIFSGLEEALYAAPKLKVPPVLHWIGKGPV